MMIPHHAQQHAEVVSAIAAVSERVQCLETAMHKSSGGGHVTGSGHVTSSGHVTGSGHVTVVDHDNNAPSSVSDSMWATAAVCVGSIQFCGAVLLQYYA